MVTINDIAKMASVSRTTVSRVLNNSSHVSKKARERVLEAIEKTGYIPSEHAKGLRVKQTNVVGVILPKISTETSSRVVNGIDEELSRYGYQILLANSNLELKKEIEHLKLLQSRRVDGIILMATNVDKSLQEEIKALPIPTVALGQEIPGVTSVVYDDYHAACDLTQLFINKGHRKIAFIGVSEEDKAVGYLRKKGYLDTMKNNNLSVEDFWMAQGTFNITSGYHAMKEIWETSSERPTAVFAVTDRLAIGVMEYLQEKGLNIPKDISIAGIGASELSKYVRPALTTVDYFNNEAGKVTARHLLDKMLEENESKKSKLGYRLIERDSL
ncbi:LacI family DNA-binding transcriptional regulator [Alteribacillus sp. JSM 102045]|uniref:LacI family DNA-binding transcriptional regulator n=1 Tax=Alteribacillus sp. JSM 102045 TaxID=1562101 RepID=UPI0035C08547